MSRIDLPDELLRQAEAQVAAGLARSIDDVVRAGIAALEDNERKVQDLRERIAEGERSSAYVGDPFARIRERYGY